MERLGGGDRVERRVTERECLGHSAGEGYCGECPGERSTHLLDRYIIRAHLVFVAVCLGVATALATVVYLMQGLDRFLRVKPPLPYVMEHFLYRLPGDVLSGLHAVMLVATVFLFVTLNRHHELTALKAAGISVYRLAAPVIAIGVLVALTAGLFQELVLPTLNERGEVLLYAPVADGKRGEAHGKDSMAGGGGQRGPGNGHGRSACRSGRTQVLLHEARGVHPEPVAGRQQLVARAPEVVAGVGEAGQSAGV